MVAALSAEFVILRIVWLVNGRSLEEIFTSMPRWEEVLWQTVLLPTFVLHAYQNQDWRYWVAAGILLVVMIWGWVKRSRRAPANSESAQETSTPRLD